MSGYFGPMALVTTVAFTAGAALTLHRGRLLLVLGSAASAGTAAAIFGIAAIASGTNGAAGLQRVAGDLSVFGLRPLELVVPTAGNLVVGDRLASFWNAHAHGSNSTEVANYLGLLTFALAVVWLVIAFRRRASLGQRERVATTGLVAAFVVGLAFALPSPISLFGHDVWMPSRFLWAIVPAFRVISRWDPLLMTALLPLAALGLQAVWHKLAQPGRPRLIPVAAVAVAMVVSFLELAIHPAQDHFRTVPAPPEYAAVARTPRGILAEYPLGHSDLYLLWQSRHGRPIANGAPPDTQADYARLVLLDPSQPGTAQNLSFLGVTAVTIHPSAHVDVEVAPRDPTPAAGYRLVGRFSDGASVWQVVASPAPALVTLPGGFAKPQRLTDSSVGYAFISSAGVGVIDVAARSPGVIRIVFDAVPPQGKQKVLRVGDSKVERSFTLNGRTLVSVLVEVPRGQSQLLVKTDPAPTSAADAIVLSTPHAEKASGQPALHADLVSPNPGF
jgi:hypothetical protein